MAETDILIIGGGPAGLVAANTAHAYYPGKQITLVRKAPRAVVPCGIPYIFHRLGSVEKNLIPDGGLEAKGIRLVLDEAIKLDTEGHCVTLAHEGEIKYEKLVLATGSSPIRPPIPGATKRGVLVVEKDPVSLQVLFDAVQNAKNIVVIGGGFIGVEFADEIAHMAGKHIAIVEMLPHCLYQAFGDDFAQQAEAELKKAGVEIHTGQKVTEILGEERVSGVRLSNGQRLDAELVLISVGARPNVTLAAEAGLTIGYSRGIWVDEYLRTTAPDVFAVGDCAEKKDFFTRKVTPVMLASTASAEARIAGANLYSLRVVRDNRGTLATFSTQVGDVTLASAGLTERRALEEGFDIVVGVGKTMNRHPGSLPGARQVTVRLIFAADSLVLLGGEVAGPSAGELINTIALALQNRMTANQIETLQVATHPLLTAAPTVYPLVTAAIQARELCHSQ